MSKPRSRKPAKQVESPAPPTMSEMRALMRASRRFLGTHGYRPAARMLAEIPTDVEPDMYGEGGVVDELEAEVATILGKPAAVFMPSGTMAQQIVLRVHADRRNRRTILFHPHCHLAIHELGAFERLHALHGRAVGARDRTVTIDDLRSAPGEAGPVAELPAALLLELPQRDLGGQLPSWDELVEQTDWAHAVGAAAHMDGARLWQCEGFYGRPLAEIAALFDTVYVSFYKDIGALAGAAVAGPTDVIAEVREWRQRHGGTLFDLWPHAASALVNLHRRLPRMDAYREHAITIASALGDLDGVDVVPDPPHASMFHLVLRRDAAALQAAALRIAREDGTWTWGRFQTTEVPGVSRTELSVGDATLEWTPAEFRRTIERLLND